MMSKQMIYTSCRKSIDSSESGYKVYSYSEGMDKELIVQLVRDGAYSLESTGLPKIIKEEYKNLYPLAYRYSINNGHHTITRSRFLSVDWSGTRFGSNYIAHSISVDDCAHYPIEYYNSPSFEKNIDLSLFSSEEEVHHLDTIQIEPKSIDFNELCIFISDKGTDPIKSFIGCILNNDNFIIKDIPDNIPKWIAACTLLFPISIAYNIPYSSFDDNGWDSKYPGIVGIWSSDDHFEYKRANNADQVISKYIDQAFSNPEIRNNFINFANDQKTIVNLDNIIDILKQFYYFTSDADYLDDIIKYIKKGNDVDPIIVHHCINDLLKTNSNFDEAATIIKNHLLPIITNDSERNTIINNIEEKQSFLINSHKETVVPAQIQRIRESINNESIKIIGDVETTIILGNWSKIKNKNIKEKALDHLNNNEQCINQLIIQILNDDEKVSILSRENPYPKKDVVLNYLLSKITNQFNLFQNITNNESNYPENIVKTIYYNIVNNYDSKLKLFQNKNCPYYDAIILSLIEKPGIKNKNVNDMIDQYINSCKQFSKDRKNQYKSDFLQIMQKINEILKNDIENGTALSKKTISPDYSDFLIFNADYSNFSEIISSNSNEEYYRHLHYLRMNIAYIHLSKGNTNGKILGPIIINDHNNHIMSTFYEKIIKSNLDIQSEPNYTNLFNKLEELSNNDAVLYETICNTITENSTSKNYTNMVISLLGLLFKKSQNDDEIKNNIKSYIQILSKNKEFEKILKLYVKQNSNKIQELQEFFIIEKRLRIFTKISMKNQN